MEINKPMVAAFVVISLSQLALLLMKATGTLDIGWIWVFAPLWVPYTLLIAAGAAAIFYILVHNVKERIFKKNGN